MILILTFYCGLSSWCSPSTILCTREYRWCWVSSSRSSILSMKSSLLGPCFTLGYLDKRAQNEFDKDHDFVSVLLFCDFHQVDFSADFLVEHIDIVIVELVFKLLQILESVNPTLGIHFQILEVEVSRAQIVHDLQEGQSVVELGQVLDLYVSHQAVDLMLL